MNTHVSDAAHKRGYDNENEADPAKKARLEPDDFHLSSESRDLLEEFLLFNHSDPPFFLTTFLSFLRSRPCGSSWKTFATTAEADDFLKEHRELNDHITKWDLDALLAEECLRIRTIRTVEHGKQSEINRDLSTTHDSAPSRSRSGAYSHNTLTLGIGATLISWHMPFKGSPDPLYKTICQYMGRRDMLYDRYERYATFTQSSGTGKSRMNDELAKKIVYIPVNLGRAAFPPSDRRAFSYFESQALKWKYKTTSTVQLRSLQTMTAYCFMEALLTIAYDRLKRIVEEVADVEQSGDRLHMIASRFREMMSEGMIFDEHGPYRHEFYIDVYDRAMQNTKTVEARANGPGGSTRNIKEDIVIVDKAAQDLVKLLRIHSTTRSDEPLFIICFDEAHTLTDMCAGTSLFFELPRVLRTIDYLPIFTLFVSTTPLPPANPSARLLETSPLNMHTQPITLTPLDVLAKKFNPAGKWRLQKVASTPHMVHLGRPLFASRYDGGEREIRENPFNFALTKLLCSHDHDDLSRLAIGDREGLLACLGVRIPFDFKRRDTSLERRLVSHHMRLLLYAAPGFTSMVTAYASEPVLAEAAYRFMAFERWPHKEKRNIAIQPYDLLHHAFTQTEIDLGTRGEIVAAALLMDARDRATMYRSWQEAATADVNASKLPTVDAREARARDKEDKNARERIITVERFLRALLGDEKFEKLGECRPTACRLDADKPLKEAFATANIYFNHFIKVDDFAAMNQEFLLLAISRGGAIICADTFGGIDIVIPVLFGTVLAKEFVSAILVQVKNSREYAATVRRALFATMNPYACGLFDAAVTDAPPVLRMVCALASERSSVAPVTPPARTKKAKGDKFTAYDIWCAGAFHKTFDVIDPTEERILASLLANIRDPRDVFKKTSEALRPTLRQMMPSALPDRDHYNNWVDVPADAGQYYKTVTLAEDVDEGAELWDAQAAEVTQAAEDTQAAADVPADARQFYIVTLAEDVDEGAELWE